MCRVQSLDISPTPEGRTQTTKTEVRAFQVIKSDFTSEGTRCGGLLYLPSVVEAPPPVIVMAHGGGCQRDFKLPAFAERFAKAAFAVFLFDYRNFGASDGEPRNLIDHRRQLVDWNAALVHVRSIEDADSTRLALWGFSFSGGHVIYTAADNPDVKAIASCVPFVDAINMASKFGLPKMLRGAFEGTWDIVQSTFLGKPHTIPIVGKPETFAMLVDTEGVYHDYIGLVPKGSSWENACPARILLTFCLYRPITKASLVRCPALILAGKEDSLVSIDAVRRMASRMPKAELVEKPYGHFDLCYGKEFEDAVECQIEFFTRHLLS